MKLLSTTRVRGDAGGYGGVTRSGQYACLAIYLLRCSAEQAIVMAKGLLQDSARLIAEQKSLKKLIPHRLSRSRLLPPPRPATMSAETISTPAFLAYQQARPIFQHECQPSAPAHDEHRAAGFGTGGSAENATRSTRIHLPRHEMTSFTGYDIPDFSSAIYFVTIF